MVEPIGIVVGVLTQVASELADDLLDTAVAPYRGARTVADPVRLDRRPHKRWRHLDSAAVSRLVGRLAERLTPVSAELLRDLPEHEWLAALQAVADSLATAVPLDAELVIERARLRPERLEELVRERSSDVRTGAALSEPGTAAYDRVLREVCAQVVEFVTARPEFASRAHVQTVRDNGELLDGVRELRETLAQDRTAREFEVRYGETVTRLLDSLELFGVTLRHTPRRYLLSDGYISLSAVRAVRAVDQGGGDSEATAGVGAETIPAEEQRILLRGTAGAGKSTVLQRIAVDAAARLAGDPDAPVPFLVTLRHFTHRALPQPHTFLAATGRSLAAAEPPGWADAVLRDGRALVLVDGVDELPSRARQDAGEAPRTLREQVAPWLRDLIASYPKARFVVTTRLSAVPDDWLEDTGFAPYDLVPMGENGIRDLVERWHDAALRDCPPDERELLTAYRRDLPDVLVDRPELRRLAATPLLCALVCALNRDRRMDLPRDRKGLYDAALDMLLDRRDPARGVTAPEGLTLDLDAQLVLLQRFAYHLVRNEVADLTQAEAAARVGRALEGVQGGDLVAPDVLRHLLTRTGLLRTDRTTGRVGFVHRTFQDYLAAKEVLDAGDLPLLVNHAHDDQWRDVVVMAVANARPLERGTLLAGLLDRAEQVQRQHGEGGVAERLRLLAAAALEHAPVVEPPGVRGAVERAAARLIPPATAEAADGLARLGEFVLDLLPGPGGLEPERAALVVRTAALIGTPAARRVISRFLSAGDSPMLANELLRAWRRAPDQEEYARTVLADVDFGDTWVSVRTHGLRHLRHVPGARSVRHRGDLADLDVFARLPQLVRLELLYNDVARDRHLAGLAGCGRLRELNLLHCGQLHDLSVLGELPLDRLTAHFLPRLDLGSLAGFPLTALAVRGVPGLTDLTAIPAELPLRRLAFGARLPDASLRGLEAFGGLRELRLVGLPAAADVELLAGLPFGCAVAFDPAGDALAPAIEPLRRARPDLRLSGGGERAA